MNPPAGAPDGGFSHPGGPLSDGGERVPRGERRDGGRFPAREVPPDPRPRLGRLGESIAALWLRATGARILARRRRTPAGEVDIVAFERRSRTLLIVEVKTRRDDRPLDLNPRQQRRLARAAEWLHARERAPCGVRIDLIDIRLPRKWWPWPRPLPRLHRIRAAWGEERR